MYISKIHIKNFRLLNNVEINIDKKTTLFVGRNNTAKTSFMQFIYKIIKNKTLTYDDYPLFRRNKIIAALINFKRGKITFDKLKELILIPSISFEIDYEDEDFETNLGALSPFIIDVNSNINKVIIEAKYDFILEENSLNEFLDKYELDNNRFSNIKAFKTEIYNSFNKIFKLLIYAIDPSNPNNYQIKKQEEFSELFPLYMINAERHLDENEQQDSGTLNILINNYFNKTLNNLDTEFDTKIKELKNFTSEKNLEIQVRTDRILSELVNKSVGFGYPNMDELLIGVQTKIDLNSQIENKSELVYSKENTDSLPSNYNGLGYKNLIKIQFELAYFADSIKEQNFLNIPLLFIEEPESHMHPQMQQVFISYLDNFLEKMFHNGVQTFITSHSSYIANTIKFEKIRYMHRNKNKIICKDLSEFCKKNSENISFIQKYLNISKCDLFFADKAIFVEGAAEKLLFPDIIEKHVPLLSSQYYTIIEIGGAYANKFIPFMEFLEIPCAIFTDIDSVESNNQRSFVSCGVKSSNPTINEWVKRKKNIINVSLKDIISLKDDEKTINNIHIEFQTKENKLCARSLEESIRNVNRSIYNLSDDIREDALEFKERSKTDFILKLIVNNNSYNVPEYILNGLNWLNNKII